MVDGEIVTDLVDADKCLSDAEEHLLKKDYKKCHDNINEARTLIQDIIKRDESSGDVELERSKNISKSMTMPYSEKFG
jgi:hypothetical protein